MLQICSADHTKPQKAASRFYDPKILKNISEKNIKKYVILCNIMV